MEYRSASPLTRLLYCAGLLGLVLAAAMPASGWVSLALGGSISGAGWRALSLFISAAAAFRIYQVVRYRNALDAPRPGKLAVVFRIISQLAMLVGGLAAVFKLLARPLVALVYQGSGDSGVIFFVLAIYLAVLLPLGWQGCLLFEATRWFGQGSRAARPNPGVFRRKQDAIVAGALVALLVGGPLARWLWLNRPGAPEPCGQQRLACVAKLTTSIHRMVALPMGSRIHLSSNVNSIRFQGHARNDIRWEAVEGIANSLKVSGYVPVNDESLPVHVTVMAIRTSTGTALGATVSENSVQSALLTAVFLKETRLERDTHGNLNLVVDLPPGSDGGIKGIWRDASGDDQTLDGLFGFYRRSIGVDIEAREYRRLIESTPVLVKHEEGGSWNGQLSGGSNIGATCGDRIRMGQKVDVVSFAEADRASMLSEVQLGTMGGTPLTLAHRGDQVICRPDAIWILHYVSLESRIVIRRYRWDGELIRNLEADLPIVASNRTFCRIDDSTLQEKDGAIWFDRVNLTIVYDRESRKDLTIVKARDTFKLPFPSSPFAE